MPDASLDSALVLPLPSERAAAPLSRAEQEVIDLFDALRDSIFRYVLSFGLTSHDAEDIVQESFLSLFRHLQLGRSRQNLRGWLFRVAHNLSLKRRAANHKSQPQERHSAQVEEHVDPSPNAEDELVHRERQTLLFSVFRALPEQDRRCLELRAEGLRYRDIAETLGISLGAVSIALTRSLARLERACER